MLELFADRIDRGLGIDLSSGMLNLARSNLVARGLDHCSVRHGNVYALDVTPRSFDVAVVHHVLHYLENPAGALAEAASTLRPGGRLLVVDFAPHHLEILRAEHAHRRLGFADEEITGWCNDAGLTGVLVEHLVPPPNGAGAREEELLTVSLWSAIQPVTSSTTDEPFTAAAEPTASEHRPIASHQPGSADTPMEMCR
jgi:ArsR family transcriptional regulator